MGCWVFFFFFQCIGFRSCWHNHSQCCFYKGQTHPHMIYNSQKSCLPRGDECTLMPLKLRGLCYLNYRANLCSPSCVIIYRPAMAKIPWDLPHLKTKAFNSFGSEPWGSFPEGQKSPDKDNKGEKDTGGKKASVTQVPQAGCYAVCQCRSVFLWGCGQTA